MATEGALHESRTTLRPDRPRRLGHRRIERARRSFCANAGRERGQGRPVARRVERLNELKKRIEASSGQAIAVQADVLDRAAMTRAFDAAEAAFGTVTILVNNAGIAHSDRVYE